LEALVPVVLAGLAVEEVVAEAEAGGALQGAEAPAGWEGVVVDDAVVEEIVHLRTQSLERNPASFLH